MEFIFNNLSRIKHFTLATTDTDGSPWVVALRLCYDEQLNIIWLSKKDTNHSRHIQSNPQVAICVYDDFADIGNFGLYAKATAREVSTEDEVARLLELYFTSKNQPVPPAHEFMDDAPYRIYCATLTEAWINDESHIKKPVEI